MNDVKVDSGETRFDPDNRSESPAGVGALEPAVSEAKWTEERMRALLAESYAQMSLRTQDLCVAIARLGEAPEQKRARLNQTAESLSQNVCMGNSGEMIRIMCDTAPLELRDVVSGAFAILRNKGLSGIEVRLDDFDRIVMFDEEKNQGVAMAPSGSYQRVSRFYDGSYRYGIEYLLDDEMMRPLVDSIFRKVRLQIA